ncbi:MAG: glycosyltransferase [Ignavibacterium album]|nr:glycosyltransferase [Ignavibacterium album]MCX8104699.1 glycosyltransferase [Ignavibacterium album]
MKISIITATKNNKAGLIRAIESVRSQTYKNVEHIIVDGGSTDGSVELIKNEQLKIKHLQLKINNESQSERKPESNVEDLQGILSVRDDKNEDENLNDYSFTTYNDILRQAQDDNEPAQNNYSPFTNHYSLISISEPDSGIYDAINKGIKMATGDVIGLLHSDDFYADEFVLERYAEAFRHSVEGKAQRSFNYLSRQQWRSEVDAQEGTKLPSTYNQPPTTDNQQPIIDAVYSDLVYVRGKTKNDKRKTNDLEYIEHKALNIEYSIIRRWKTHKRVSNELSVVDSKTFGEYSPFTIHYSLITNHQLKNGWMPPHPTLFIRREIFDKYGLYKTDMKIAADYEMILRLFWKYKISSIYLPVTTYCMTIGGASNKSLRNILIKSSEDYKAMKTHGLPSPLITLIIKNLRKLPQFLTEPKKFR